MIPWKYGFKSDKSIVRIRLVDERARRPRGSKEAPQEYGFYSNVNPTVDHPRWSQATERRIGEFRRRKTLMFNGYGDQVASLYAGMDLRKSIYVVTAARPRRAQGRGLGDLPRAARVARLPGLADDLGANPISYLTNCSATGRSASCSRAWP